MGQEAALVLSASSKKHPPPPIFANPDVKNLVYYQIRKFKFRDENHTLASRNAAKNNIASKSQLPMIIVRMISQKKKKKSRISLAHFLKRKNKKIHSTYLFWQNYVRQTFFFFFFFLP